MAGFRTGLVLLVDGGKRLYRAPFSLQQTIPGCGTPLEILKGRLGSLPGVEGPVLLMAEGSENELAGQARALGLSVESYSEEKVVEQSVDWRPERWGIPDDAGIDFLVGSSLAALSERRRWETVIVVPLRHLLVDAGEIAVSLRIHLREGYDASFTTERVPGAGWLIFQNELLQGMQKSHEDIMNARGGLIWALRKPLYPFKIGYHHAPRDRCGFPVDLRFDRRRVLDCLAHQPDPLFARPEFSYATWIRGTAWRERYADAGPETVLIEPSSRCQGRCTACPQPALKRERGLLAQPLFERVVSDFGGEPEIDWVFSGMGEPFEHPRLGEMVSALRGRRVRLETSLQPSPPEDFPWEALSHLRISVDALEESWFGKMRPGCDWKRIERFIASAAEKKRENPNGWPAIGVSFLKHRANDQVGLSFVKYWKKVTIAPFHANYFLWPVDQLPDTVQWFQVLGVSDFLGGMPWEGAIRYTPLNRRSCRHGLLNMTIQQDGRVALCRFDHEGRYGLGRVDATGDGPMALWKSDGMREFRRRLITGDYSDAQPCRTCMDWYHS